MRPSPTVYWQSAETDVICVDSLATWVLTMPDQTSIQIRELYGGGVHFPPCFPAVAKIEIVRRPIYEVSGGDSGQTGNGNEIPLLQLTESTVLRLIPFDSLNAVFIPADVDPGNLDLDDGLWIIRDQFKDGTAAQILQHLRDADSRTNPDAKGIAFVEPHGRMLNVLTYGATALESVSVDAWTRSRKEPCRNLSYHFEPCRNMAYSHGKFEFRGEHCLNIHYQQPPDDQCPSPAGSS